MIICTRFIEYASPCMSYHGHKIMSTAIGVTSGILLGCIGLVMSMVKGTSH